MTTHYGELTVTIKGLAAGYHLVKHNPQRIDIASTVYRRAAFHLFRRGVINRAHHRSRLREPNIFTCDLCQAEVGYFDDLFGGNQDIGWLNVAVCDCPRVSVVEGLQGLASITGG